MKGYRNKRRTALQAFTVGGMAAAAKLEPTSWTKPMVNAVVLPAHAQTSDVEVDSIECMVTACFGGFGELANGFQFSVSGQVNGLNVAGSTLDIRFTATTNDGLTETTDFQTTVQDNNQYSDTFVANASDNSGYQFSPVTVAVSLGDVSCTSAIACDS